MRLRTRALRFAPLALAGLALLAAAPADAALGEGDFLPRFEGKEFLNTDAITLDSLQGRLVLCEVFSPT